eukprot:2670571-Pleurochrysis_carterae.AAC.1
MQKHVINRNSTFLSPAFTERDVGIMGKPRALFAMEKVASPENKVGKSAERGNYRALLPPTR